MRICDAQTRGDESFALAGLIAACVAQTALDYDERLDGAAAPLRRPRDRGEPLAGDPLRRWRADDRLPARRGGADAGGCSSSCSTGPSRRARSSGSTWRCPERNGAQRAREALGGGVAIEEIYRDAVAETRRTYAGEHASELA